MKHASSSADARGYRKGEDGLLEMKVPGKSPLPDIFVPVVPKGQATAHMSWKRWMFLQVHIGVFGGHRNEEKTFELMKRLAYWDGAFRISSDG